jgi:DNA (cytosine-5)-methyltransferase 1
MLTFVDLFAGIGGFSLGLERAGMKCVGQVEIDPFCCKVLEKHWPRVKRLHDIREVQGDEFGTVDLVCGGFPCQPFSTAGKRRGKADDRYLWPEMRRFIEAVQPRWLIAENVPGITSLVLDEAIAEMESLGYASATLDFPAVALDAAFEGRRIFIVASTDSNDNSNSSVSELPSFREENILSWRGRFDEPGPNGVIVGEDTYTRLCRTFDGIPDRMDRLRVLGNSVVPQQAEVIGRAIVKVDSMTQTAQGEQTG